MTAWGKGDAGSNRGYGHEGTLRYQFLGIEFLGDEQESMNNDVFAELFFKEGAKCFRRMNCSVAGGFTKMKSSSHF